MTKVPSLGYEKIIKALQRDGWVIVRQKLNQADNNLYVGFTQDLRQRFEQHNKGSVESTSSRRPFKLIYYEACRHKSDAIRREKYLKTHHRKMYLKKRHKSYLTG